MHAGAYCVRASTIKEYMQANLDVSRESRVTLYEKAAVRAALPSGLADPVARIRTAVSMTIVEMKFSNCSQNLVI